MNETGSELVKNVIVDYTDITSWILIAIAILTCIIQAWQNHKLSEKIEKYKDDLARNQFKFSRHTELQIEALKSMYDLVVTFHFSYCNVVTPLYYTHNNLQTTVDNLQSSFIEAINYCHRNKILLPDDITEQIRVVHEKFKTVELIMGIETDNLLMLELQRESTDPQQLYYSPEDESAEIRNIIKRIMENEVAKNFEADIKTLRGLVETYFKKLVA